MKYQVFHNPKCSKSREALALLTQQGKDFEIVEYLKHPPTVEELKIILMKLNLKPEQLVRKGEEIYKQKLKGLNLSDQEWIKVLCEHPILIERPIVVKGNKAVVARPASNIEML
jgi:arsenate reductase